MTGTHYKTVAIVGRPNVGKSTLYNRLIGGRPALVHDTPGLTRDRRYGEFDHGGHRVRLIDTGGLDPEAAKGVIGAGIHRQAEAAMTEADALIFVVDAVAGVMGLDQELAARLRKLGRPILVAANKVDSQKREVLAGEVFELGFDRIYPISAAHGRGIDELLDDLVALWPAPPRPSKADTSDLFDALDDDRADLAEPARSARRRPHEGALRVALVGKPNAGKSSILNRLVGSERSLVHDVPGTTTDPVDTAFSFGGKDYVLIDTAGIRRRARIQGDTEKLSVSMSFGQMERADVVVLVVDVEDGASEQDARLADLIERSGRAVVVALNKSDLLGGVGAGQKALEHTDDELHFLTWAPRQLVSAARGDGMVELMALVDKVAEQHCRRITTAELNRFFAEICEQYPPTSRGGKLVTVHYLTQGGTCPPTFLLWANRPRLIDDAYRRFVVNQLRKRYGFEGTPIRVVIKAKAAADGRRPRKKRSGRR